MANVCPICNSGLKIQKNKDNSDGFVYCSNMKMELVNNEWQNKGSCGFKLSFNSKLFGAITREQMVELIQKKPIKNKRGDTLALDLSDTKYFSKFAKAEDEAF